LSKWETLIGRRMAENGFYAAYNTSSDGTAASGGHAHEGIEILYIRQGFMEFSVPTARHIVHAGSLVVCPGEIPHASRPLLSEGYDRIALHVLPQISPKAFLRRTDASWSLSNPLIFQLDSRARSNIEGLLDAIVRNSISKATPHIHWLLSYLGNLENSKHVPPAYLWEALDYIQENIACDVPFQRVADRGQCSVSRLYEVFTRYMGCSPKQYQAHLRVARASELLQASRSVSEVSQAVGYTSPRSLQAAFRRVKGVPPTQFRPIKTEYHL